MNTLNEIIQQRRSIRHYDASKPVSRETVEQLLAAAVEAPSWKNKQTSRYHVVMSADLRNSLRECLAPQNSVSVADAPVLIVTTFVKNIVGFEKTGEPTNELQNGWGIYDLGLQSAILLLKATEMGLGTIVLGLRNADAIRHLLHIPDDEIIVSVIGVGYTAENSAKPKRKTVADIATFYE